MKISNTIMGSIFPFCARFSAVFAPTLFICIQISCLGGSQSQSRQFLKNESHSHLKRSLEKRQSASSSGGCSYKDMNADIGGGAGSRVAVFEGGETVSLSNVLSRCLPLPTTTNELVIFALDTVHIDTNMTHSLSRNNERGLNLAIIAPHWVIEHNSIITLNGPRGLPMEDRDRRPGTAQGEGRGRGRHGRPGPTGGGGGSFFGVGLTARGDGNLRVISQGGVGGKGEDGEEGFPGAPGEEVALQNIIFQWESRRVKIDPRTRYEWDHQDWVTDSRCGGSESKIQFSCSDYWFYGRRAGPGGQGGNGGEGGAGGQAGEINFVFSQFSNATFPLFASKEALSGMGGVGGVGGRGGRGRKSGNTVKVRFPSNVNRVGAGSFVQEIIEKYPEADGLPGRSGPMNLTPPYASTAQNNSSFISKAKVYAGQTTYLNWYRTYTLGALPGASPSLQDTIQEMKQFLSMDVRFRKFSPLMGYIEEFLSLESQYNALKRMSSSQLKTLYALFIEKVSDLVRSVNDPDKFAIISMGMHGEGVVKKTLLHLYTAGLSRLSSFGGLYNPTLVLDMERYLDISLESINSFKADMRNQRARELVRQTTKAYEDGIKEKTEEAGRFINDVIQPEIERIQETISTTTGTLLEEIRVLRATAVQNKERLAQKREELQRNLIISAIFGAIKAIAGVLSIIAPPISTVISAAVVGASSLAESQLRVGVTNPGEPIQLPPAVLANSKGQINAAVEERTNRGIEQVTFGIDLTLGVLQTAVTAFSNNEPSSKNQAMQTRVTQVTQTLTQTKTEFGARVASYREAMSGSRMGGASARAASVMEMATYVSQTRTELTTTVSTIEVDGAEAGTGGGGGGGDGGGDFDPAELGDQLNAALSFAGAVADVVGNVFKAQADIDEVTQQIGQVRGQIDRLDRFQTRVEEDMTAILRDLNEGLGLVQENLSQGRESLVALDVAKWQISQRLTDVKHLLMDQFTEGFEVDRDLSRGFDQLQEAFTTLIQVYSRMEDLQEEARLSRLLGLIGSAPFQDIKVDDPMLNEALLQLDRTIQTNVILGQYELILNSVKIWAFPFASAYLQHYEILESGGGGGGGNALQSQSQSIESMVAEAVRSIREIRQRVVTRGSTLAEVDTYLNQAIFRNARSSQPFYIWRHEEFGDLIGQLLSGKEVLLMADITQSPHLRDAVKFREVDIEFVPSVAVAVAVGGKSSEGAELLSKLKDQLSYLKIELTHMGNSYYRFHDKFYTITSPQVKLSFSFERQGQQQQRADKNSVFKKILAGDILLSPYAMWTLQLVAPFENSDSDVFKNLEGLVNSSNFAFDLHMTGAGSYVRKADGTEERLKLAKFYREDTTIFVSQTLLEDSPQDVPELEAFPDDLDSNSTGEVEKLDAVPNEGLSKKTVSLIGAGAGAGLVFALLLGYVCLLRCRSKREQPVSSPKTPENVPLMEKQRVKKN